MKDKICTSCGYVGKPTSQGVGSFAVDGVIWIIGISLSVFSSIFAIMLIPVAWTVYHVVLYKTTTCPKCGDIAMVGLKSKKAQHFREDKSDVTTVFKAKPQDEE